MEQGNRAFPDQPASFISLDSSTSEIEERTDAFFNEIIGYLGYNERAQVFLRIEDAELHYEFGRGVETVFTESNDYMRLLILKGEYLLASVLKWRTGYNRTQVSFSIHFDEKQADKLRFIEPDSDILSLR